MQAYPNMFSPQTSISFGGGGVLAAIMRDQFQERTNLFFILYWDFVCVKVTPKDGKEELLRFNQRYD